MKRQWWLVGAGVVAIVAAIALFPSPDTGGAVDGPTATERKPRKPGEPIVRPGAEKVRREFDPATALGPHPAAAEAMRAMNTPEAVYAGRLTGPLAMTRRAIVLAERPELTPLADESLTLMNDLRALRRDPTAGDFPILEERIKGWVAKVRASPAMELKEAVDAVDRIDAYLVEYHTNPQLPQLPANLPGPPPPEALAAQEAARAAAAARDEADAPAAGGE